MDVTSAVVDTTAFRVDNDNHLSAHFIEQTKKAQDLFSQEHGDGQTHVCDKSDVGPPKMETEIDENRLDDFVRESLTKVAHDMESSNRKMASPKPQTDMQDMETEIDDRQIEQLVKETLDNVVRTGTGSLDDATKTESVIFKREYPTYKPRRHVTIGTLDKILIRLGLKKKPRHGLQKGDISWPLPGSLIIRGPDGLLEDGLISMFVSDLLSNIIASERQSADITGPNLPMKISASATTPNATLDKDIAKEIKSEGDFPTTAVPLTPTTKKSRKFLSRLFGDCGRSNKSPKKNSNQALEIVA